MIIEHGMKYCREVECQKRILVCKNEVYVYWILAPGISGRPAVSLRCELELRRRGSDFDD
jgi:hypothetical protein